MTVLLKAVVALLLTLAGTKINAADYKYIQSNWLHELGITRLVSFKDGEFLVLSDISQRRPTPVVKYHLEVKVPRFDQAFTMAEQSPDMKQKETLTVLLHPTSDPTVVKVAFEHAVYESGEVKFRFSGVTYLPRW